MQPQPQPQQQHILIKPTPSQVPALVQALIHHAAPSLSPSRADGLLSFCLRLLSARLSQPTPEQQENIQIISSLKSQLNSQAACLQLDELIQRFLRVRSLHRPLCVLSLLCALPSGAASGPAINIKIAQKFHIDTIPPPAPTSTALAVPSPASSVALSLPSSGADEIPESLLMRDILYVFQGIDGQYIAYNSQLDAFLVNPIVRLGQPTRVLIERICEVGWLYRKTCLFINGMLDRQMAANIGLVEAAFVGAIQTELNEYYRLIAVLESQFHSSSSSSHFTYRRLFVWIQEPTERLRILALLCDSVANVKGGCLASVVGAHLNHGDRFTVSFVGQLVRALSRPLLALMSRWMERGELNDAHGEFFIEQDATVPADRLWSDKYTLRKSMIPSFVSPSVALLILTIGKSVNFIRVCCAEPKFVAPCDYEWDELFGGSDGQVALFERAVERTAAATNKALMKLINDKYNVKRHCVAMKNYLLLGQGDFIQHLMDLIAPELDKPARDVYQRNLAPQLDLAIRGSNARYEDESILARLTVRLMAKAAEAETGWDVFTLDYAIDQPLNVIFPPVVINSYLRIFNFLWRLKRVETALKGLWLQQQCFGQRILRDKKQFAALHSLIGRGHTIRHEMQHVIHTFQHYLMFEVLECSWREFSGRFEKCDNFDSLFNIHANFVQQIYDKALLGQQSKGVQQHLSGIIRAIHDFCALSERLYKLAEQQEQINERVRASSRTTEKAGQWTAAAEPVRPSSEMLRDFDRVSSSFKRDLSAFRSAIQAAPAKASEQLEQSQNEADIEAHNNEAVSASSIDRFLLGRSSASAANLADLEFLSVRLDFNEFYSINRK